MLQSGIVATWMGLDVTRRVRLTRTEAKAMAATDDPATDWCALHDPLAVDVDPVRFAAHITRCLRRLR